MATIETMKELVELHGINRAAEILNMSKRTLYRRIQPLGEGRWGAGPSIANRIAIEYRAAAGHIDVGAMCLLIWGEDNRRTRNRLFDTIYHLKLRGEL